MFIQPRNSPSARAYQKFLPANCDGYSQPDVRFGSKADMCSALGDVCFVPKADIPAGLIDYFIGEAEQRRRHGETKHSGGLRIDD
jgi:hypothetical protein